LVDSGTKKMKGPTKTQFIGKGKLVNIYGSIQASFSHYDKFKIALEDDVVSAATKRKYLQNFNLF
jgi:hypothetical protein